MIFTWNSNWLACSILPGLSTHIKIMSIMWAMLEIFWKNRKKKKKSCFFEKLSKIVYSDRLSETNRINYFPRHVIFALFHFFFFYFRKISNTAHVMVMIFIWVDSPRRVLQVTQFEFLVKIIWCRVIQGRREKNGGREKFAKKVWKKKHVADFWFCAL